MAMSFLYLLLASCIVAFEVSRRRSLCFDQLSIATVAFLANIVLPASLIHFIVDGGLVDPKALSTFPLLEHVYRKLTFLEEYSVFIGSCAAYASLVLGYRFTVGSSTDASGSATESGQRASLAWLGIGLLFLFGMYRFGESLAPGEPVRGLLLSVFFRSEDPDFAFVRDAVNANVYALTHTFLLFAMLGYALADESPRKRVHFLVAATLFLIVAVVASGARRSLLIVALLGYMYVANRSGNYRLKYIVPMLLAAVPLLYYGKSIFRGLGTGEFGTALDGGVPYSNQILVAASEVGISHVESLGTMSLYGGGPRFGVDHVLSILRFLPDGMVGLDIPWPERIVRVSTAYLIGDPSAQDIPPGYVGQCWIDFPALGFFLMPAVHGMVFGFMERIFRRFDLLRSPARLMAYLIVGYLVALPFNSGSLDFVFSVDVALAAALLLLLDAARPKSWTDTAAEGAKPTPS